MPHPPVRRREPLPNPSPVDCTGPGTGAGGSRWTARRAAPEQACSRRAPCAFRPANHRVAFPLGTR